MPNNIFGTPNRDVLVGDQNPNDLADRILGYAGIDTLTGLTGDDRINGGADFDEIAGNDGNDVLIGGGGADIIGEIIRIYQVNGQITFQYSQTEAGNDVIYGGGGSSNSSDVTDYLAGGAGNDKFFGGLGSDVIGAVGISFSTIGANGESIIDTFIGSEDGNDLLDGDVGNDNLAGGTGNDKLRGEIGNDYLGEFSYEIGIRRASGSDPGNDTLDGGDGDDVLVGGQGNDKLLGGDGDDQLNGYPRQNSEQPANEKDTLTGGIGADQFILGTRIEDSGDGGSYYISPITPGRLGVNDRAVITDFNPTEGDTIQLYGSAASYRIGASPLATIPGTAIYYGSGASRNLVTIVQSTSFSNFSTGFTFVL